MENDDREAVAAPPATRGDGATVGGRSPMDRARFIVVGDASATDPWTWIDSSPYAARMVRVHDPAVARASASEDDVAGIFVDFEFDGDRGDVFAEDLRRIAPSVTTALVVREECSDAALLNRAADFGILVLAYPFSDGLADRVACRALEAWSNGLRTGTRDPHGEALGIATHYGLTKRETEILLLSLDCEDADAVITKLGIGRKTYDSHVSRILTKTGDFRLYSLLIRVYRRACGGEAFPERSDDDVTPT